MLTSHNFQKLLKNGIRPDYVIETDANARIGWHFRETWNETVPMLLLSTAAHDLVNNYAGEKYLVFQKDYPKAEKYVAEHLQNGNVRKENLTNEESVLDSSVKESMCQLYETGGSVMTTALDIAIRLGCKKIVFLGLDLAYTDNFAHASDTSRREITKGTESYKQAEDINGKMVLTSKPFEIYRKWIEKRIERERNTTIQFIDATEGGAKIRGTKIVTLKEVLKEEMIEKE